MCIRDRFWTTVLETGMTFPMILSLLFLLLGLIILGMEFFRRDA